MTFGQMLTLTQRFNQILGASQVLKGKRLQSLAEDIKAGFSDGNLFIDAASYWLYNAVLDEISYLKYRGESE